MRPLGVVICLLGVQGVVGAVQWGLELPGEIVWLHIALATITWLAMLWTVAVAGRLVPRHAEARSDSRSTTTWVTGKSISSRAR